MLYLLTTNDNFISKIFELVVSVLVLFGIFFKEKTGLILFLSGINLKAILITLALLLIFICILCVKILEPAFDFIPYHSMAQIFGKKIYSIQITLQTLVVFVNILILFLIVLTALFINSKFEEILFICSAYLVTFRWYHFIFYFLSEKLFFFKVHFDYKFESQDIWNTYLKQKLNTVLIVVPWSLRNLFSENLGVRELMFKRLVTFCLFKSGCFRFYPRFKEKTKVLIFIIFMTITYSVFIRTFQDSAHLDQETNLIFTLLISALWMVYIIMLLYTLHSGKLINYFRRWLISNPNYLEEVGLYLLNTSYELPANNPFYELNPYEIFEISDSDDIYIYFLDVIFVLIFSYIFQILLN